MVIYEDFSFTSMTAASLEFHIQGLRRTKAIWRVEMWRCEGNAKASKTLKEREYWEGRQRHAMDVADDAKVAYEYLENIKRNHYE